MKLRHYYVLVFCLLMLAIEQARIHTHLHVVECKLTDSITDADGTREWDGHTPWWANPFESDIACVDGKLKRR